MDGLPSSRQIDHLALFKEINEFVSFYELLEPLSPYSSDSDASLSAEDDCTNVSLFDANQIRVKNRYKPVDENTLEIRDPSDDKLFQMLAKGTRNKTRDPSTLNQQQNSTATTFMSNSCSRVVSIVNEEIIKTGEKKKSRGKTRIQEHQHQEQEGQLLPSLSTNDFSLNPCSTSSLQHLDHNHHHLQQQQQNAVQRSALVKLNSLHISDRGSYFNTLDKGLSKYPNYFDYVDNIKKPFKQIEDMSCGPSSGLNQNSLSNVTSQFDCPPSPDLSPDILSALNSCLYSSN